MHWAVQQVVFDIAVNHGPQQAVKLVQRVCNLSGIVVIQEDGIIGPMTIRGVDRVYRAMGNLLINAICDERILFYRAICANDPTTNLFAWLAQTSQRLQTQRNLRMNLFEHIPMMATLLDTLGKRIDDLFTSDEERGEISIQQQKWHCDNSLPNSKAQHTQLQINLQQTKHPSIFVAAARKLLFGLVRRG